MLELKRTPFHERTSRAVPAAELAALGRAHRRRLLRPARSIASTGRSATRVALIDVSPLMKYMIEGPDAARLLHKLTPRDILKMAVGQVDYTGWCDDDGKLLDDGTVSRLGEHRFRMTSAEPSLRWLSMNAVGMDVTITEVTEQIAALSLQGPKSRTVLNRCCAQAARQAQVLPRDGEHAAPASR